MTAPTDDTTGTLTRTEAETSTEIAARPAPAADASLEALGRIVAWVEVAKKEAKTVPGYVDLWKWLEIPDADTDRKIGEQVVRAVDASRPAAAIERTLNINALARCARAALRIEVPDVVAWEALPEAERVGWRVVVRCILASTTLASRPGLTEEQAADLRERAAFIAETCSGGDHTISNRDLIARRIRELPLRASRGETGPAPTGLTSAMHDAQQRRSVPPASAFGEWPDEPRGGLTCPGCYDATGIAQPHDPRATLRAGDPASPFAPGSLAAGSATEDRILDRKRGGK